MIEAHLVTASIQDFLLLVDGNKNYLVTESKGSYKVGDIVNIYPYDKSKNKILSSYLKERLAEYCKNGEKAGIKFVDIEKGHDSPYCKAWGFMTMITNIEQGGKDGIEDGYVVLSLGYNEKSWNEYIKQSRKIEK
jgi:hypothetical protein